MVEVHFVLGVVDQRPRGSTVHCRFRFEPSGEGALTHWIEMLGPEFEVRMGRCQCMQVKGGNGQDKTDSVAVNVGQRTDQSRSGVA